VSEPSKREAATAHHEAGHAVVGLWERLPTRLIHVSIVPDAEDGSLGHTQHDSWPRVRDIRRGPDRKIHYYYRPLDPEVDDKRRVERLLKPQTIMLFAGVLAERRFSGHRHNWVGAADDVARATDRILAMTTSQRQAQKYTAFLWVVTEDAVDRLWSNIEALAQELLTRRTMTGGEVTAFQQAWRPAQLETEGP
jgi:hypothetical protein